MCWQMLCLVCKYDDFWYFVNTVVAIPPRVALLRVGVLRIQVFCVYPVCIYFLSFSPTHR